jgi:hypothetical protein
VNHPIEEDAFVGRAILVRLLQLINAESPRVTEEPLPDIVTNFRLARPANA